MHLSSSGNHSDALSAVNFALKHLPTALEVKHLTLHVDMLPTVISLSPITIEYIGECIPILFMYSPLFIITVCVCSIAEGCTLKLVLAMRGGPINTRRGKEKTPKLHSLFLKMHFF